VSRILYWLAVLVISLGVLVALVLFLESRDPTSVEGSGLQPETLVLAYSPKVGNLDEYRTAGNGYLGGSQAAPTWG
jgi:hypothetical protein